MNNYDNTSTNENSIVAFQMETIGQILNTKTYLAAEKIEKINKEFFLCNPHLNSEKNLFTVLEEHLMKRTKLDYEYMCCINEYFSQLCLI